MLLAFLYIGAGSFMCMLFEARSMNVKNKHLLIVSN